MSSVVFIHGAGAAGADAWPQQAEAADARWFFLPREGVSDEVGRDARRVLDRLQETGGAHLVAHSYGANTAVLAAQLDPSTVRSLALLEPACFDLARGKPAVEEHVTAMTSVYAVADDPAVPAREFFRRFAAGMGFEPRDLPDDELEESGARLRALSPPWDVGLRAEQDLPVRTLVVTAGWSPLYEQTAASLVALGARHVTLEGAGHRVQDDPRVTAALREHWAG